MIYRAIYTFSRLANEFQATLLLLIQHAVYLARVYYACYKQYLSDIGPSFLLSYLVDIRDILFQREDVSYSYIFEKGRFDYINLKRYEGNKEKG